MTIRKRKREWEDNRSVGQAVIDRHMRPLLSEMQKHIENRNHVKDICNSKWPREAAIEIAAATAAAIAADVCIYG